MNNEINETPGNLPKVEWIATAASRIYAARADTTTAAAVGAAMDIWNRTAALATPQPNPAPWKIAFQRGEAFEREAARLAQSGIDISRTVESRPAEAVAMEILPKGSKLKAAAALAELQALAKGLIAEFQAMRELAGLPPLSFTGETGQLNDLAEGFFKHGLECRLTVSNARMLYLARARTIREAKAEAGRLGGRPKSQKNQRKPQRAKQRQ